jgi:hypothetical protein
MFIPDYRVIIKGRNYGSYFPGDYLWTVGVETVQNSYGLVDW